jgi:hypothetical protein
MEIEDIILKADEVDSSGLIFPKDVIIQAVRDYNDRPDLKVGKITSDKVAFDIHEVTHKIKEVSFDDVTGFASAQIELLDTAASKIVYNDPHGYFLEPVLIVNVTDTGDDVGVVTNVEIVRIDIAYKPEQATNSFFKDGISPTV